MDMFGIGAALQGVARVYFQSARRSGRTTALIEGLRPGDRVVCPDTHGSLWLRQKISEVRGPDFEVDVTSIPPENPERLFQRGPSKGRTIFDHTWVEQYYLRALDRTAKDIRVMEQETSSKPLLEEPLFRDIRW